MSIHLRNATARTCTDVLTATLIWSGVILIFVVLFLPETFPPILLYWKAKHLRELTGDQRYRGSIEIRQEVFFVRLRRSLYRPFLLTFREPIVILVALYLTVIYIVLFTFLEGFTFIYQDTYGISQGLTGLCFLSIIIGLFGASALVPLIHKWAKRDLQKIKEQGGDRLPPEFRLWYSMLGGAFALPISLFWMGWTARPDIPIWSPLASSILFGYGMFAYIGRVDDTNNNNRNLVCIHYLLPIHHRFIRNICCFGPSIYNANTISGLWRHDSGRDTILQKPWGYV